MGDTAVLLYITPVETGMMRPTAGMSQKPAVVMLEGAKVRLLRRAERFEDVV